MVFLNRRGIAAEPGLYFYADQTIGGIGRDKKIDQSAYFAAFICHAFG